MILSIIASDIIAAHLTSRAEKAGIPLQQTLTGAHPTGNTVQTLAVAEWLIEDSEHTPDILAAYLQKWAHKYHDVGYARPFEQWLVDTRTTIDIPDSTASLRVAPIALYAHTPDEALHLAKISAEATHSHPDSIKSAQATAAAIHLAYKGTGKQEIKRYIEQIFNYNLGTAQETTDATAEAIRIYLNSNSLEETIRRAAATGNPTIATISASIASATGGDGYTINEERRRACLSILPSRMINYIYTFNHLLAHPTFDTPIRNSYKVDDRIYAGEYPATANEKLGRRDIDRFIRFGITHFIDLTESGELLPYTQWLHKEQTHIRFAIKDCGVPTTDKTAQLIKTITTILKEKENRIYIHCRGGIGRTGTIVACYYATFLKEYHPVIDLLTRQYSHCPKSAYRSTPETLEQKRFIMQYIDYISKQ
ncbi:MAG: ADP-ribosylglycohydrolase family protein [Bacteroidaceae bacterium]|nr:ADP-ribosylglycohydrolase family protein [Bacteroidaceae bacterium]